MSHFTFPGASNGVQFRIAGGGAKSWPDTTTLKAGAADFGGQMQVTADGVSFTIARDTTAGNTHEPVVNQNDLVYFQNIDTTAGLIAAAAITASHAILTGNVSCDQINAGGTSGASSITTASAAASDNVLYIQNLGASHYSSIGFMRSSDPIPGTAAIGIGNTSAATWYADSLNIATNPPSNNINGTCPPIKIAHESNDVGGYTSHQRIIIDPAAKDVTLYGWTLATVLGPVALNVDANGTVAVGTKTHTAGALLEVNSTTQAFLPPRMTTTQKNAIGSPVSGMVVYDSTLNKLCVRGAAAWETITSL